MSKYIIRAATLQNIASAIRTKTGKTDKIPVESFAKEIEEISGGGGGIIEVDTLPTENISETDIYKCGESYYKYSAGIFSDLIMVYSGGLMAFVQTAEAQGWTYSFNTISTKTTENIQVTDMSIPSYHWYYIEDENDVFIYGDIEGTGTVVWHSYGSLDGGTFNGFISDESEATAEGYYAVGGSYWTNYIAPEGSVTIVANGTFDVTEKAEVTVNVETVLQEKTVTGNGVVTADEGYDGLSKVTVSVPLPSGELEITQNGTYDVTDKSSVTVEVESESADGGFDILESRPKISLLGSVPFGNVGGNITTIYQDISNLTITKGE